MPIPDFSNIAPSPLYNSPEFKELKVRIQKAKENNRQIIFASGVFDGLHEEHKNFLHQAKILNGFLVVAIESDARTKALKGPSRPIHPQHERLKEISSLSDVDGAFILPDDFSSPTRFEEVVWQVQPSIMAVSSHSQHLSYKTQVMNKYGGSLAVVHQHNPAISTTKILASKNQALPASSA